MVLTVSQGFSRFPTVFFTVLFTALFTGLFTVFSRWNGVKS